MKKIPIQVIEDNRIMRDGIAAMLNKQPDMLVVESVTHGKSIGSTKSNATIVLLGLGVRNQYNVQTIRVLKQQIPAVSVVVMDLIPNEDDVFDYIRAGVSGFILKNASAAEFVKTIRTVHHGAEVLPPLLIGPLFSHIAQQSTNNGKPSSTAESVQMTKREREIIALIADGSTNNEIAEKLHLSVFTVKSHVHNILNKLAVKTRVQISKYVHLTSPNIALIGPP